MRKKATKLHAGAQCLCKYIEVSGISTGFYMMHIQHLETGNVNSQKIVINQLNCQGDNFLPKIPLLCDMQRCWISLVFVLSMIFSATAQDLPDTCFYQTSDWPEISDSLSSAISQHIDIDTAYAPAFYTSLAHYPDLYDTEIHFREKKIKTTAATRPSFWSVFKKPDNRSYWIFINNKNKQGKSVYYTELPYNAKIGLMGHELSHILDYSRMSSFEMMRMGIKYVFSSKYRQKLEYHVDQQAIDHNIGYQVYTFSDFINNKSQASPEYINYKRKYYMLPDEIIEYMQHTDSISDEDPYLFFEAGLD